MKKYMLLLILTGVLGSLPVIAMDEFYPNNNITELKDNERFEQELYSLNEYKTKKKKPIHEINLMNDHPELFRLYFYLTLNNRINGLPKFKNGSQFVARSKNSSALPANLATLLKDGSLLDNLIHNALNNRNKRYSCKNDTSNEISFFDHILVLAAKFIQDNKDAMKKVDGADLTSNRIVKALETIAKTHYPNEDLFKSLQKEVVQDSDKNDSFSAISPASKRRYALIIGGIALGAAAIVGIGYWIKKQFFDKKKKIVQTNKPHIAS